MRDPSRRAAAQDHRAKRRACEFEPVSLPKADWRAFLSEGIWPNWFKLWIYRRRGYRIGRAVRIGFGTILRAEQVTIADNVAIGSWTSIFADTVTLQSRASIGGHCLIRARAVFLDEAAVITGYVTVTGFEHADSTFTMGANSILMYHSYVDVSRAVRIGHDTGVGGHCLLFTHAAWGSILEGYPVRYAPIEIADGAWLPWRVFVTPGVTVGERSVISAGSVVTADIPPRALAGGVPAKVLREEFVKPPAPAAAAAMVEAILDAFADYLVLHGRAVTRSPQGLDAAVSANPRRSAGSRKVRLVVIPPEAESVPDMGPLDVAAAPWGLSLRLRAAFDARGLSWFDLRTNRRSQAQGGFGRTFETFVVRFGLRFRVQTPFSSGSA